MENKSYKKQELWAYIIELDKIVNFRSSTSNKYHIDGSPREWLPCYSKDDYIGSGYIVGYELDGTMWQSTDLLYFYK